MDSDTNAEDDSLSKSSSSNVNFENTGEQPGGETKELSDNLSLEILTLGCQRKDCKSAFGNLARPIPSELPNSASKKINKCDGTKNVECKDSVEPVCQVKLNSILQLKESTRKLLCLLEEIQLKTHSKYAIPNDTPNISKLLRPIPPSTNLRSVTEILGANALRKLETQTNTLEAIYIQDEDDDCAIYKRLTRKCHCLNNPEYNDFIIHFNENTKFSTSYAGEIIKNMRILKKFLYMNGGYTNNALKFLNEGLTESTHAERVDIIHGCSYSDICNVFEEHSIVVFCISWPCKYEYYGNATTQALAASFLYKLALLEEGRRYLNFSSKITNDTKKVLRKKASKLEFDTVETLNATLNLLHPPLSEHINVTYYCKPIDEGIAIKTINALVQYRKYMTLDEVFTHLDMLLNMSNTDNAKVELTSFLPSLLNLFRHVLIEYDNSEMNIIITNILNNIVSRNMVKDIDMELPKPVMISDVGTEPIQIKKDLNHHMKKHIVRKQNKSKLGLGLSPNRHSVTRKQKVNGWESTNLMNKSRKFRGGLKSSIIVVPIEKESK